MRLVVTILARRALLPAFGPSSAGQGLPVTPNHWCELARWLARSRADRMPDLTLRLDVRLKAVAQLSGHLAEIVSQASGPAESPRPTEPFQCEA